MPHVKKEPSAAATVIDGDATEVMTVGRPSVYSALRDDRSKARK